LSELGILILDDDKATSGALHQMLDSEGWNVKVVASANEALAEMASGAWRLVIANVTLSAPGSVLFSMLSELSQTPVVDGGAPPLRVVFLVPEAVDPEAKQALDRARLPYAMKPFHLHDLLDKISDQLLETGAILAPIRRVQRGNRFGETKPLRDSRRRRGAGPGERQTAMFAAREDYPMTEEEILEFERQEEEERKKKLKKKDDKDHLA
jgi:DNA-binding response OmpR family regulator